jgi:D-alanyl-D-alanine carboxypeptidase
MDMSNKKVLFAKEAEQKRKIASITKIMTAIVAIEETPIDRLITIHPQAVGVEGSSIYLKKGEKIPLRSLLYGLMLRSGNDAAEAIARAVGGSREGFVFLMNQKAEELGMEHTHFVNPHGLDEPGHYSSAHDMAVLTAYAMKNPQFREIVKSQSAKVDWAGEGKRYFHNKNKFLRYYQGADGVKTGYTKASGRSLVTTVQRYGKHLVCVTINAPDDWNDHRAMYDYYFTHVLKKKQIVKGSHVLKTSIQNLRHQPLHLVTGRSFSYHLSQEEQKELRLQPMIAYPLQHVRHSGQVVGTLEVFYGQKYLGSIPLVSQWGEPIRLLTWWKRVMVQIFSPGGSLQA